MYNSQPAYPTPEHEAAAQAIVEFFSPDCKAEAVLLVGSCARGRATSDSCLDIAILLRRDVLATYRMELVQAWQHVYETDERFQRMQKVGRFSHVDLDFIDGKFVPGSRGWTSGPDNFELEIGNYLAYSYPLWQCSDYYEQLRIQWLPYYDEDLRRERLQMVRKYCLNNLDHIPLYARRGLYFQCLDRLYNAHREFLQALFIARRTYPIAYDKWIYEQIGEILALPDLYVQLTQIFGFQEFENEVAWIVKAEKVRKLLEHYTATAPNE